MGSWPPIQLLTAQLLAAMLLLTEHTLSSVSYRKTQGSDATSPVTVFL
jgi:hypothetical protein